VHCDCDPGFLEHFACGQKLAEASLKADDDDLSIAKVTIGQDIGLDKQLFMDTELLKHWSNVSIIVHHPRKRQYCWHLGYILPKSSSNIVVYR
jgi:hypothetical protein